MEIEAGGSGGAGADGFSPVATVTQTDSGAVISITDKDGTTTATITNGKDGTDGKDGENGADGANGKDGITPHIGDNGNWWIGEEDTGVIAQGKNGVDGKDGENGTATDEQVTAWLDAHPEATTSVQDGAISPVKTSFMPENFDELAGLSDVKVIKAGIRANGTYYYHAYMGNNGLSLNVEGLSKIVVKAFASYINWIQTATEVTASGVAVISNGYTTENPSMYGATADTDAAEMREVEIDIAEGASYILIDFGLTAPTYAFVGVPNGTYRFDETVAITDKMNRPTDENGDFADGAEGQVLYANGDKPYWGNKINPGDVNAKTTTFWGSDKLSILVNCEKEPRIELPWTYEYVQKKDSAGTTFFYHIANYGHKGAVIHLKAGVEYVLLCANHSIRYWKVDPRTIVPIDFTETESANLEYNGYDVSVYKNFDPNTDRPVQYGLYQTKGGKITPTEDWYINVAYEGTNKLSADENFSLFSIYEASKVEYLGSLTGGDIYSMTANKQARIYTAPFLINSVGHDEKRTGYYEQYETNEKMRRLIRQTDWLDSLTLSNFRLCFIGDSITYAASNAGLQRAFRKMVPYKLQVTTTDTAVAGTCMTNGFGTAWSCGTQGVDGLLVDAPYIEAVPNSPFERPHIFMIALGTNDFGNDAPLGDVESADRSTTFAGCYLKLIESIRANYPKSGIILMCPFNRNNGDTANANGDILLDYSRVIHEIASFTPHTWVLDLSNHPLINYAGYQEGYVDGVHIGKYAHAVVSNELYRLIMEIVAVSGFDYLPCLDNLNA